MASSSPPQMAEAAAAAAAAGPAGPVFGKKGVKPSFMAARPVLIAPRGVERTKDLPIAHSSTTLAADKALIEAQARARALKKTVAAVPGGGQSIKATEMTLGPAVSIAKPPAKKAAPSLLAFLGGEEEPSAEAEAAAGGGGGGGGGGAPSVKFTTEEVAPARTEVAEEKVEAKPLELSNIQKFNEIKASVTSKVSEDPIKVHPASDIFMPINRRGIHEFIIETYQTYILQKPLANPVGDACQELSKVSSSTIENFAYQEFVRDYMQRGSPYRGILVYHGLGSGKTCTSIAAAEGLRHGGTKKIFTLTPATLSANYHDQLSLCGYYALKKENFWERITVPQDNNGTQLDDTSSQFIFLTTTYGLSAEYLIKRYGKRKQDKFWIADPSKPSNFESLTPAEKADIEDQIKAHMDDRFEFIHYNGLREDKVRGWICGTPANPTPGNLFDNSVVVIDEVHNLIRTIVGSDLENIYKTEPRENKKQKPDWRANYQENATICGLAKKYRIAYGLYRLLCDAVGCKIIALSGTPIINKPHEIAVLSNILAGDKRIAKIPLNPALKEEQVEQVLMMNPSVDFYSFTTAKTGDGVSFRQLNITPVPSGLRKVVNEKGEFKGFMRLSEDDMDMRERNLPVWFERDILPTLGGLSNILGPPIYNSMPQLPDTEKEFVEAYVDKEKLAIKNNISLRSRLTGLISYYKGSKKELVATVTRDEVVLLDMSDLQLAKYLAERSDEIKAESKPEAPSTGPGIIAGLTLFESNLYVQATKSVNSAFKIFSRAACNFVFPDGIVRPRPSDSKKAAALLGVKEEGGDEEGGEEKPQQLEVTQSTRAAVALNAFLAEDDEDDGEDKEQKAVVAAAEAAVEAPIKQVAMEYDEQLKDSIVQLRARAADVFAPDKLKDFSPKYAAIFDRVKESKGPVLVYSNFKTLEGLGLFAVACEYQNPGFIRIDIIKGKDGWELTPEFKAAVRKDLEDKREALRQNQEFQEKERFIVYSGDEPADKKKMLLDIFNLDFKKFPASMRKKEELRALTGGNPNNFGGKICKMFMITQSGAEGISLKNVRQVHIMEPFWNYVRLEQVQGRAIRICSHKDLPLAERTVDVFTYIMKFSDIQKRDRKVDETISMRDKGLTTDQIIYTLMMTKRRLSEQMFDIMKSSAIDCLLNALEHGSKSCFMITSGGAGFLYNPDYREDLKEAQSQYRLANAGADEAAALAAAVPAERAPSVAAPSAASAPPGLAGAGDLAAPAPVAAAAAANAPVAAAAAANAPVAAAANASVAAAANAPVAAAANAPVAEAANANADAIAGGELPVFQQPPARNNLDRNEGRLNVRPKPSANVNVNVNVNAPNLKLEEGKNNQ